MGLRQSFLVTACTASLAMVQVAGVAEHHLWYGKAPRQQGTGTRELEP